MSALNRVDELIDFVVASGGILRIDGDNLVCVLPKNAEHVVGALKENKPRLIAALRECGSIAATFPRCPWCLGRYLYRENNKGTYECQTCGQAGIEESIARRVM